jgi:Zn-dependent metalloprotease
MALKQRQTKERASTASWIVGEGIFTTRIKGRGIRSFKNEPAFDDPILGLDDQPKHMDDYQDLPNDEEGDYGGVHTNSGIPNRAFYEFCVLAEKEVSDEWVNRSWKAPLEIWFDTYHRIRSNADFRKFAYATVRATKSLHPQLQTQILKAWETVGIKV